MRRSAAAGLLLLASCFDSHSHSTTRELRLTPEEERILRPVSNASDRVSKLVDQGDELFRKGIPVWRASDPETGPSWAMNVDPALDLYSRARTFYLTAQSEYPSPSPVPAPILDRVRECVMRIAALQKLKHSPAFR